MQVQNYRVLRGYVDHFAIHVDNIAVHHCSYRSQDNCFQGIVMMVRNRDDAVPSEDSFVFQVPYYPRSVSDTLPMNILGTIRIQLNCFAKKN